MFFINPFIYAGGGDFEPIATVTVGSGGASSIEFTSIPSTYQHLQIRMLHRNTGTNGLNYIAVMQVGASSADTGSNYSWHLLRGNGSSASASSGTSQTYMLAGNEIALSTSTLGWGAAVIDILDYGSTSKNKTIRSLNGVDSNGDGYAEIYSGLWMSTSAIGAIKLSYTANNFAQYSTAALYGVKAP
jgi:hypothetical protein